MRGLSRKRCLTLDTSVNAAQEIRMDGAPRSTPNWTGNKHKRTVDSAVELSILLGRAACNCVDGHAWRALLGGGGIARHVDLVAGRQELIEAENQAAVALEQHLDSPNDSVRVDTGQG